MTFKRILWMIANVLLLMAGVLQARTTGNVSPAQEAIFNGIIPKTSFSCRGRLTGYYADIETDCQTYHMCDQQGRQFDYLCPNATLFQQRMLVCDHWYMVDCRKSEANYGFNSLIGQKDQHFVSDSDAKQRTPRPDLLDRPYAPDYKGESFRKHVEKSNFQALQNAITGFAKSNDRRFELLETQASGRIVPHHIHSNNLDPTSIPASEDFPQFDKNNDRRNAFSAESEEVSKGIQPPSTSVEPPNLLPTYNVEFRRREEARLQQLGLPLQSTNQFSNQKQSIAQFSSQKVQSAPQKPKAQPVASQLIATKPSTRQPQTSTTRATTIRSSPVTQKVTASSSSGSSIFKKQPTPLDLDKNYKAFEHILQFNKKGTFKDYDFSRYFTKKPVTGDSSDSTTKRSQPVTTTTARPTTTRQQSVVNFNQPKPQRQDQQQTISAQRFAPSGFVAPASSQSSVKFPSSGVKVPLQTAPKQQFQQSTTTRRLVTTTTQAPPRAAPQQQQQSAFNQPSGFINNKFQQKSNQFSSPQNLVPTGNVGASGNIKEPNRDLLPPVDVYRNYDDITTQGPKAYYEWKIPDRGLLPPKLDNETESHTKQKKSIAEEGNSFDNDFQSSETRRSGGKGNSVRIQYRDLQRQFSIPQVQLPIEADGRDGYEKVDAVNSFQVKIPYRKDKSDRYYYLEHAHCNPECHPYFFKPGRCEPCIKLQ